MTRCNEFYEKVKQDGNFCGMSTQSFDRVKAYLTFIEENDTFVPLAASAITPLIRERDEEVKAAAISTLEKSLKYHKPPGSGIKKILTAKEVKEIIEKEREVKEKRKELEDAVVEVPIEPPVATIKEEVLSIDEGVISVDSRIPPSVQSHSLFNRTNDNIEWAHWSWNPITGCKRGCPYCYAHDIGMRFHNTFEPQFHPERMTAPQNTKVPQKIATIGDKNVFVCSMADLFGSWIDSETIRAIINATAKAPQWNFLFLTKSPERLKEFTFPRNAWIGATIDEQKRVQPTLDAFNKLTIKPVVLFISMEPFNEKIKYKQHDLDIIDWLILGGRSESSGMCAFQPKWVWVESVLTQARNSKVQVYFKPNLVVRPREYPDMENF